MTVTPIKSMGNLPEHGRIRTGIKSGRSMKALSTFRFTSVDETAIRQLAQMYGGEPRPWHDSKASPPNQWEVITNTDTIEVAVQPDSVFASYELWSGGGLQRQCDGETVTMWQASNRGLERMEEPCICDKQGMLECRPKTRMNLIIPQINFAGTWRYETSSEQALHTLPTMLNLIDQLQQMQGGLMRVTMHLVPKEKMKAGQKRKFTVVEVRTAVSVDQIISGEASYTAEVSAGEMPALEQTVPQLTPTPEPALEIVEDDDDDVVDAEIVEEDGDAPASGQGLSRDEAFARVKASGGQLTAKKTAEGWVVT
jgi:hypothetical protein